MSANYNRARKRKAKRQIVVGLRKDLKAAGKKLNEGTITLLGEVLRRKLRRWK